MQADEEEPAYEEVYAELIEATLSSLSTVDTPESASRFVAQAAPQIQDLSARISEFCVPEFLAMLADAFDNPGGAESTTIKQALDDARSRNMAVEAELNARLNAARAAGDRAAQHAVWQEFEVRKAEVQAGRDELNKRVDCVALRLGAFKSLLSLLESKGSKIIADQELAPESREVERSAKDVPREFTEATVSSRATVNTPEWASTFVTQQIWDLSAEEVYAEFTEATLSSLATVDTPESATTFIAQTAQQIQNLSAVLPEFYALEFLALLRDAVMNLTESEMVAIKQAISETKSRTAVIEAEMNARLNAARAGGDRAAQHALWREGEVRKAAAQAEMDEVTRYARLVSLRLDAARGLQSSVESKDSVTPADLCTAPMKANPPASKIPQGAAVPPRRRLIRSAVDAEVAAAEFMRTIGFADAKRTPSGADGGIDVIAAGAVAQVKTHMKPIGRPDLQRLCGVAKGRTMLFFSLEGYTPEARKWGDLEGMALFRFDLQGEASPINHAAKVVMAGRAVPPG